MNAWAKRGLQAAFFTGGMFVLGAGIASATECCPDRPTPPLAASVSIPTHICDNAMSGPGGEYDVPCIDETISTDHVMATVPGGVLLTDRSSGADRPQELNVVASVDASRNTIGFGDEPTHRGPAGLPGGELPRHLLDTTHDAIGPYGVTATAGGTVAPSGHGLLPDLDRSERDGGDITVSKIGGTYRTDDGLGVTSGEVVSVPFVGPVRLAGDATAGTSTALAATETDADVLTAGGRNDILAGLVNDAELRASDHGPLTELPLAGDGGPLDELPLAGDEGPLGDLPLAGGGALGELTDDGLPAADYLYELTRDTALPMLDGVDLVDVDCAVDTSNLGDVGCAAVPGIGEALPRIDDVDVPIVQRVHWPETDELNGLNLPAVGSLPVMPFMPRLPDLPELPALHDVVIDDALPEVDELGSFGVPDVQELDIPVANGQLPGVNGVMVPAVDQHLPSPERDLPLIEGGVPLLDGVPVLGNSQLVDEGLPAVKDHLPLADGLPVLNGGLPALGDFPLLENSPVSGDSPILGDATVLGDRLPLLGDDLPLLGDGLPALGDDLPVLGEPQIHDGERPELTERLPLLGDGLPALGDEGLPLLGDGLPALGDEGLPLLGDGLPALGDEGLPLLGDGLPSLGDEGLPLLGDGLPGLGGEELPLLGDGLPALGDEGLPLLGGGGLPALSGEGLPLLGGGGLPLLRDGLPTLGQQGLGEQGLPLTGDGLPSTVDRGLPVVGTDLPLVSSLPLMENSFQGLEVMEPIGQGVRSVDVARMLGVPVDVPSPLNMPVFDGLPGAAEEAPEPSRDALLPAVQESWPIDGDVSLQPTSTPHELADRLRDDVAVPNLPDVHTVDVPERPVVMPVRVQDGDDVVQLTKAAAAGLVVLDALDGNGPVQDRTAHLFQMTDLDSAAR